MDVTEDTLLNGISKPRNQLLFNNAVYLLPYVGIGSGIVRAFKDFKDITLENDLATEEFVATVWRLEDNTMISGKDLEKDPEKDPEKDLEKDLEKLSENQRKILLCIKGNEGITQSQLSKEVGISPRNIRNNINRLKELGLLTRIGPDKGGHWEIKVANQAKSQAKAQ